MQDLRNWHGYDESLCRRARGIEHRAPRRSKNLNDQRTFQALPTGATSCVFDSLMSGMRTACVTIRDSRGRPFVHVTMSATVLGAVREAIDWFLDPYTDIGRPEPESVIIFRRAGRRRKVFSREIVRFHRDGGR